VLLELSSCCVVITQFRCEDGQKRHAWGRGQQLQLGAVGWGDYSGVGSAEVCWAAGPLASTGRCSEQPCSRRHGGLELCQGWTEWWQMPVRIGAVLSSSSESFLNGRRSAWCNCSCKNRSGACYGNLLATRAAAQQDVCYATQQSACTYMCQLRQLLVGCCWLAAAKAAHSNNVAVCVQLGQLGCRWPTCSAHLMHACSGGSAHALCYRRLYVLYSGVMVAVGLMIAWWLTCRCSAWQAV